MKRFVVVITTTGLDHVQLSMVAGVNAATAKSATKKAAQLSARFLQSSILLNVEMTAHEVDDAGLRAIYDRQFEHYLHEVEPSRRKHSNDDEYAEWRLVYPFWAVNFDTNEDRLAHPGQMLVPFGEQ